MYLSLALLYEPKCPYDSLYTHVSSDWNNAYIIWAEFRYSYF